MTLFSVASSSVVWTWWNAGLLLVFLLVGSVLYFSLLKRRFLSIIPIRERPAVPWDLGDAILAVLLFNVLPGILIGLFLGLFPSGFFDLPTSSDPDSLPAVQQIEATPPLTSQPGHLPTESELRTAHPLSKLLLLTQDTPNGMVVLIFAFITGVIAAPFAEEFFFRVVFQGALERWTFPNPFVSSQISDKPGSVSIKTIVAIVVPALVFAAIHYRNPEVKTNLALLQFSIMVVPFGLAVTAGVILLFFKARFQLTLAQFGIFSKSSGRDVLRGLLSFLVLVPVLIPVLALLRYLFPEQVTDPIPIFILALGLGILYYRTHSYFACVTMHAALNLYSFLILTIGPPC